MRNLFKRTIYIPLCCLSLCIASFNLYAASCPICSTLEGTCTYYVEPTSGKKHYTCYETCTDISEVYARCRCTVKNGQPKIACCPSAHDRGCH